MSKVNFKDKTIVITGAGRGLGREYALQIAKLGGNIVVNDLGSADDGSAAAADQVVEEVKSLGGDAVAEYSNIATPEGGANVITAGVEKFGRIDAVINNAGILRDKSLMKMEIEDFDAVLNVHLRGSFFVTKAAFPIMKEQQYGRFVFTTSAAGLFGNFGQANYAAAKMGLVGLSNIVAIEGAKANILSNVIAPGAQTRMTENMGSIMDAFPPAAIAPIVAFLASDACSVSQNIYSAGGRRYARTFVATTPGWKVPEGYIPTPDEIADNFDAINSEENYIIPRSILDEAQLQID